MNQNGRIYVDTSTTPNKGVEIADLQTVFSTARNDIGQIIANEDINKWAKYKPVRSSSVAVLTDTERKAVNYGLKVSKYTNLANFVSGYSSDYEYNSPRGGGMQPKEWYRLLDFNGYNHNAVCPVNSFQGVSGDVPQGTNLQVSLYLNPQNQSPVGSLQWSDLCPDSGNKNMDEYYFGVIIRTGTTSTYRIVTMSETLGNGNSLQERSLYLPASYFDGDPGTSYTLYPVLSWQPITSIQTGGTYQAGLFSIPNTSPTTFTIRPIQTVVSYAITPGSLSAWVEGGKYKVSFEGAVLASQSASGTIYYRIYAGQDTTGTPVNSGEFLPFGPIPTTVTRSTKTVTINGVVPEYVTAVLVYQDVPSLPETAAVSTEPPDLEL